MRQRAKADRSTDSKRDDRSHMACLRREGLTMSRSDVPWFVGWIVMLVLAAAVRAVVG